MLKHVGKHDQKKAVLLFKEVPGDDEMCLIVYTGTLPAIIHDPLMKCVESIEGQNANDITGPLSRTLMDTGQNVLNVLHQQGYIRKVPTNQMILTPNASTTIRLDELNQILREMQTGEEATKRLRELDEAAGLQDPTVRRRELAESQEAPVQEAPAIQPVEPLAAPADGVLTDAHIAQGQIQQAEGLERDAARLLAEAQTLKDEAYLLAPELKPKATRKKAAPKKTATAKKRGPGRPRKNAAASS